MIRGAAVAAVVGATLATMSVTVPPASAAVNAAPSGIILEPLTRKEMAAAQTIDIGCYWSLPGERVTRFAAADDHAAVKFRGYVIRLRPAKGARDMFPFTYDAWTDGDLRLTVSKSRGRRRSGGVVSGMTVLTITASRRRSQVAGEIECGD